MTYQNTAPVEPIVVTDVALREDDLQDLTPVERRLLLVAVTHRGSLFAYDLERLSFKASDITFEARNKALDSLRAMGLLEEVKVEVQSASNSYTYNPAGTGRTYYQTRVVATPKALALVVPVCPTSRPK